jgi:hypothetical protein
VSRFALRAARLAAALAILPVAAGAEDRVPSREDLERFEWALDRAVRKVSRPSAAPLLGGAEACRGYHLAGYGALFVLAPRALPLRHRTARESPPQPPVLLPRPALAAEPRAVQPNLSVSADLLEREAQVVAQQRAAETAREEAELALEELYRRLVSSTLGEPPPPPLLIPIPAAPGVGTAEGVHPPPPVPPWRFWFDSEEREEPRGPELVVKDVRSAVTDVLENHGPPLRLAPEEFVVVVVDFLPRSAFATRTRPARTLVVRVRKGELEDRAAGKLAADELRRRIEYSEY